MNRSTDGPADDRTAAEVADTAAAPAEVADAAVVGAGPAGLSAALYLARYNRRVLLFDTGHGRSTHHQVNHNYLGFPDGVPTVELRRLGLAQLARYPQQVRVARHRITGVRGNGADGFVLAAQQHRWRARTVLLATGVLDHFPHFPGWEPCVGRSMFWCITCDGWENRGRRVLVVGHTDAAAGEAMQLHALTDDVTLLTNSQQDGISGKFRARLRAAGIPVLHDRLRGAEAVDGRLRAVLTERGRRIALDALFSIQGATPENVLARELGLKLADTGHIVVDTEQKTSVPGVYAAGDITSLHSHQVTAAVHEGAQAASAANYFLYPPELRAD
ncbi:NAD(P)/FAD-dependent oxidoreductase [Kitasatospora sp. NPDC088391]|uniref:NAD(P)/FAD-dependent oxidoreductase n=1 Tax=Kitasatospora sp. NPDC088391 TaxID=3364074 RepID=UPI00381590D3